MFQVVGNAVLIAALVGLILGLGPVLLGCFIKAAKDSGEQAKIEHLRENRNEEINGYVRARGWKYPLTEDQWHILDKRFPHQEEL